MRFGSREICDVVFKARTEMKIGSQTFKAGQPVLYIDTAKTSSLEQAADTVYAQGGQGNPRLIAWEGNKTLTFTFEDALLSPMSLALLSGAGVVKRNSENRLKVHTTFDLPILDGGKVKIDLETAGLDNDIYVNSLEMADVYGTVLDNAGSGVVYCSATDIDGQKNSHYASTEGTLDGVYEVTKDYPVTITFDEQAAKYVGNTMRVDCYAIKPATDGYQLEIDAAHFAGNFYIEASTLFREQSTGEDMPAQFIIPNGKIQSNFTLSMSADGDPSTFTFTIDAFPAYNKFNKRKKVQAVIQVIGEENIQPESEEEQGEGSVNPNFTAVVPGYDSTTWPDNHFGDDTVNTFDKLGRGYAVDIDGANVTFNGTLNHINNWTAFSPNPEDLTGNYMPIRLEAGEEGNDPYFVKVTPYGKTIVHKFGATNDGPHAINLVLAIDKNNPVVSVYLAPATYDETALKAFTEAELKAADDIQAFAFDFGRVNFK